MGLLPQGLVRFRLPPFRSASRHFWMMTSSIANFHVGPHPALAVSDFGTLRVADPLSALRPVAGPVFPPRCVLMDPPLPCRCQRLHRINVAKRRHISKAKRY